jgi:hypothetical protein
MLQEYVPNVSVVSVLCGSTCFHGRKLQVFYLMLHMFHIYVARICSKCSSCFRPGRPLPLPLPLPLGCWIGGQQVRDMHGTKLVAGWRTQDLSMMVMRAPPTHSVSGTFAGVGEPRGDPAFLFLVCSFCLHAVRNSRVILVCALMICTRLVTWYTCIFDMSEMHMRDCGCAGSG